LGTLCGAWLLIVQVAFVHRFCVLCDVAHACGFASLILLAVCRPAKAPGGAWAGAGVVALVGTAALVLGQLLFKPEVLATSIVVPAAATQARGGADTRPAADSQSAAALVPLLRPVNYFNVTDSAGTVIATLDLDDEIILGDPNAPRTVVQFMDFGCPECGQEFELMQQLWRKHPHWFRMVVLLFPGNKECNAYTGRLRPHVCEIARAALALRKHSPEHYREAHALFFKLRTTPLTGGMAWQMVRQMAGTDDKVLNLPVLLANGKMIEGAAESAGDLQKHVTQLIGPAEAPAAASRGAVAGAGTVPSSQPSAAPAASAAP
jgi:hypothetical protein